MSYIPRTNLNFMSMKNKQYKIDKGLMLFTQPRSPFFYGKIRLNRKYVTKSFAPITDIDEAKAMLFAERKRSDALVESTSKIDQKIDSLNQGLEGVGKDLKVVGQGLAGVGEKISSVTQEVSSVKEDVS